MSKLEEVARAMCAAAEENWDAQHFNETANGDEPEEQREYWRVLARAAIEAMRKSTPAMFAAGREADARFLHSADSIWQAMIDAALKDA